MKSHYKYLVIGAGVSGLTFANALNDDCCIIEKENSIGGLCRTIYQDGFVWDYAGHFFHFANEKIKSYFESKINKTDINVCNKNTKIYYKNKLIDYPFQMNIHQLDKEEFIDCLYDLFNRKEKENYNSFLDMLYGKFGISITEKFLKPYNEKLYACELDELDINAMGRFFPYASPKEIIDNMKYKGDNTYNSQFDYPKNGAITFIEILRKNIEDAQININKELEEINPKEKKAKISGKWVTYDNLISTIPLDSFLKVLPSGYTGISSIPDAFNANKVLVFNLGFDKASIDKNIHWIYFPEKQVNFYRIGFYNNILNQEKLSMYVEIGYRTDELVNEQLQLELTLKNLKKYGIISDHKLVSYNSLIINPAYVHITEKSKKAVGALKSKLDKDNIYLLGRYGTWTYCSIEDCMIQALNLVREIGNHEPQLR